MNERQILPKLHHHLIPGLISAFQSNQHLYLVLPLLEKGDLRYHISKFKQFAER
jgi:serine/threonine protein kinase